MYELLEMATRKTVATRNKGVHILPKFVRGLWKRYDAIDGKTKDIIAFVGSLVGLVSVAGGVAVSLIKVLTNFWGNGIWESFPWIMCLIFVVIIMWMRHQIAKYKKNMWRRLESDAGGYYSVLVKFADYYFDMLHYREQEMLNLGLLTQTTIAYLRNVLDKVCDIYKSYTGSEMNACIKVFGKKNEDVGFGAIDVENATVYTLVRSSNLSPSREEACDDQPVPLKGNTDFRLLVQMPAFYRKHYLYQQNLQEFDKYLESHGEKYENTTENYWEYYKGALIVPIRMSHAHLPFTKREEQEEYHILGFLCIDTLSTEAFISEFEDAFVQMARSFAALIYVVLNKYHYYLKKCNESKVGGKSDDAQVEEKNKKVS